MLPGALAELDITFLDHVRGLTEAWWTTQGRFFPIAILEGSSIFVTFQTVETYKLFQFAVIQIVILLTANLISPLALRPTKWLVSVVCLTAALQYRNWYDPVLGFASMIPSSAIKISLTFLLLRHAAVASKASRRRLSLAGATVLWFAAVMQYETVISFLPSLLIAHRIGRPVPSHGLTNASGRRARLMLKPTRYPPSPSPFYPSVALCAATIIYVGVVLSFGPRLSPSPAYQPSIAVRDFLPAYLKQLSGSLPFSWFIAGLHPKLDPQNGALVALTVFVLFLIPFWVRQFRPERCKDTLRWPSIALGLNLVFAAPFSSAISLRWQEELEFGYGYINVFYQYLGMGILLSALVHSAVPASNSIRSTTGPSPLHLAWVSLLVLCLLLTGRALLDQTVDAMRPSRSDRQVVIDALAPGGNIFEASSQVSSTGVVSVVSDSYDPNLFINATFFNLHSDFFEYAVFKSVSDCGELCADGFAELTFGEPDHIEGSVFAYTALTPRVRVVSFPAP